MIKKFFKENSLVISCIIIVFKLNIYNNKLKKIKIELKTIKEYILLLVFKLIVIV